MVLLHYILDENITAMNTNINSNDQY